MLDLKALLAKIMSRLYKPKYFASTTTNITTGNIETKFTGAHITLPADNRNYLIVAYWTFNTRTTTGTTNNQIEIYNQTLNSVVATQRIMAGANNYGTLQCVYLTDQMSTQTTYYVRGASSRPTQSAQTNWIQAIAIN